jgi:hypothetical protein
VLPIVITSGNIVKGGTMKREEKHYLAQSRGDAEKKPTSYSG